MVNSQLLTTQQTFYKADGFKAWLVGKNILYFWELAQGVSSEQKVLISLSTKDSLSTHSLSGS